MSLPPLPSSEGSERDLLALMLAHPSRVGTVRAALAADDFWHHRDVYEAMLALDDVGAVIDPDTVTRELRRHGRSVPPDGALSALARDAGDLEGLADRIRWVKEAALRRRLVLRAREAETIARNCSDSAEALAEIATSFDAVPIRTSPRGGVASWGWISVTPAMLTDETPERSTSCARRTAPGCSRAARSRCSRVPAVRERRSRCADSLSRSPADWTGSASSRRSAAAWR